MKVAVCMSGALRGLLSVLDDIYSKVIEPLNADVFFCSWDRYFKWPGMINVGPFSGLRNFGHEICRYLPSELQSYDAIKKEFPRTFAKLNIPVVEDIPCDEIRSRLKNIVSMKIYSETDFENAMRPVFTGYFDNNDRPHINQLKMFFMIFECNKVLTDYTNCNGVKYDLLIKIRPDLHLPSPIRSDMLCKFDLNNDVLVRYIGLGLDDAIFMASPDNMSKICSLWNEIQCAKTISPYEYYRWFHSHFLLDAWCVTQRLRLRHFPMFSNMNLDGLQKTTSELFPAYHEFLEDIEVSSHRSSLKDLERHLRIKLKLTEP